LSTLIKPELKERCPSNHFKGRRDFCHFKRPKLFKSRQTSSYMTKTEMQFLQAIGVYPMQKAIVTCKVQNI
jgi:hypothetical protein